MVAAPEHLSLQVRRDARRPKRCGAVRRCAAAACIRTKIGNYIVTTPSVTMRRHSVFARCRCGMCPLICHIERSHATNVTDANNGRGDEALLRPRLAHAEDRPIASLPGCCRAAKVVTVPVRPDGATRPMLAIVPSEGDRGRTSRTQSPISPRCHMRRGSLY